MAFLGPGSEQDIRAGARSPTGNCCSDPFALKRVTEPVETRVAASRSFVGGEVAVPLSRASTSATAARRLRRRENGGRGVPHRQLPLAPDLDPRIPEHPDLAMVGGRHRLYRLRENTPVVAIEHEPVAGPMIASLQTNRAFHDVEPVVEIAGERRAFYMAVSCSQPIWRKETHRKLSVLNQNLATTRCTERRARPG